MAISLKFGNGSWATQESFALAFQDQNNNFKPLPFSATRATIGTYSSSALLLKTAGINEPRVNYINNSKGALLLEPTQTNIIPNSENFDVGFSKQNTSIATTTDVNVDGSLSALKMVENTANGLHQIFTNSSPVTSTSGVYYSFSFFVKAAGRTKILGIGQLSNEVKADFDLTAKTATVSGGLNASAKIEEYSNGWFRCTISGQSNTAAGTTFNILLNDGTGTVYTGDGTSGAYVWGAQVQTGEFSSSYIPTYGTAATRTTDDCKIVNSPILNATNEFTLFFEAKDFVKFGTFNNNMFVLGAGVSAQDAGTGIHIFSNVWYYFNGSTADTITLCYNATTDSKFAISYDGTKFTTFANGVIIGSTTLSASMSNWDTLTNGVLSAAGANRVVNLSHLQLYNTALTDSELINLTQA